MSSPLNLARFCNGFVGQRSLRCIHRDHALAASLYLLQLMLTLREADGIGVVRIVFSPDGNSIVASMGDSTIRIWELEPPPSGQGRDDSRR